MSEEIASDGTQTFRGEVKEWKPGRRLMFTFSKAEDAVHPSTISVDFIHTGDDAATVRIHHLTGDEDRFNNWDGFVKAYRRAVGRLRTDQAQLDRAPPVRPLLGRAGPARGRRGARASWAGASRCAGARRTCPP